MTAIGEEITLSVALGTKYLLHHYRRRQPTSTLFCPLCDSLRYSREFEVICPRSLWDNVDRTKQGLDKMREKGLNAGNSSEYVYSVLDRGGRIFCFSRHTKE